MKPADLAGIHDILPLQTPAFWPTLISSLLLIVIMLLTLLLLWRQFHPLSRLQRQLKNGRIPTRQAAHRLARHIPNDTKLRADIDTLRFSRQPPEPQRLLTMIDSIRKHHAR